MCEYQRINPDNPKVMPMCAVDNKPCAFCIFGNKKIYNEAKAKENKK